MRVAVVRGINGGKRIVRGEILVDPSGAKILADVLDRIAESFRDAALGAIGIEEFRAIGDWPKSEKWLNARHGLRAGCIIRHQCEIAEPQRLAEALVIGEENPLVLDARAA